MPSAQFVIKTYPPLKALLPQRSSHFSLNCSNHQLDEKGWGMHRPDAGALIRAHSIGLAPLPIAASRFFPIFRLSLSGAHAWVARNGLGKSLLARLLAGKLASTCGRIEKACRIGCLPQELPSFTGTVASHRDWARHLEAYQRILDGARQ